MTDHELHYDPERYEFPDQDLLALSTVELRALMNNCLPLALDMVDGMGGPWPVQIDHAQDRVEQARDILLDRGEEFDQEQRDAMPFLDWPKTPEEKAEEQARFQREREEIAARNAHAAIVASKALVVARAAFEGRLELGTQATHGIQLVLSRSSRDTAFRQSPTGAEVLALVEQLQAMGESSVELSSYSCSMAGVDFANDPEPAWKLRMDLPTRADTWTALVGWGRTHTSVGTPTIEFDWEYKGLPETSWESLFGIWPKSEVLSLFDALLADEGQRQQDQPLEVPKAGETITHYLRLRRSVRAAFGFTAMAASMVALVLPEGLASLKGICFGLGCFCIGVLATENAAIWTRVRDEPAGLGGEHDD